MGRLQDLIRFYELLDRLAQRVGGPRRLAYCDGRQGWPERGVYFFFETGESRTDSGSGPRVVRVGTHALARNSGTSFGTAFLSTAARPATKEAIIAVRYSVS